MLYNSLFKKNGPARCWKGFKPVEGKDAYEKGSCAPASERKSVISAKQSAASKGKYKRSSKSNVSGTASKNLKDWVKQDWRQVGDPSKKCGE